MFTFSWVKKASDQRGQVALIAILIILAVAVVVSTSVGLLSVSELDVGFQQSQSESSLAMAEACLEEALIQLRHDRAYTGGNLTFDLKSCTIGVTEIGLDRRQIDLSATVNDQVRKIRAEITFVEEGLQLDSWQETY